MASRGNFDQSTTADQVLEGIDIAGKHFLVTGGSSGLGAETARALASKGANVTITARNLEKAKQVAEGIHAATGNGIAIEELELGSFASIRAFATRINSSDKKIDVLINNAGVMACPHNTTEDGLELQFGSNHIGHFLMTNLVSESLVEGGRVVSLSSAGHKMAPVDFDDPNFEHREYDKWVAYGQAKTANALFAVGLNSRLAKRSIEAFAVHPGVIVTDLGRHLSEQDVLQLVESMGESMSYKSVEQGAATQTLAATAPELTGKGGSYLANCKICELSASDNDVADETTVRAYAVSKENADRLWSLSEKIVAEKFRY
ncbi:MAG: SDR family NAD(P)-dependent oxidoreductase [Pseudomonadales bacterium]|nr:MAG: SDR family NAD(P)-dependent oxidoreductase [Pseudomonadales bacterium]